MADPPAPDETGWFYNGRNAAELAVVDMDAGTVLADAFSLATGESHSPSVLNEPLWNEWLDSDEFHDIPEEREDLNDIGRYPELWVDYIPFQRNPSDEAAGLAVMNDSERLDVETGHDSLPEIINPALITFGLNDDTFESVRDVVKTRYYDKRWYWSTLKLGESAGFWFKDRAVRVKERARNLGKVGISLITALELEDIIGRSAQADLLSLALLQDNDAGAMRICAYSILCTDFPLQVDGNDTWSVELAHAAVAELPDLPAPVNIGNREVRKEHFKLKSHPGASNKANVFFSEAIWAARRYAPTVLAEFVGYTGLLAEAEKSDDQAAAALFAACCWSGSIPNPAKLAVRFILDPGGCKHLTTLIKSLGLNGTMTGAMLCEAQSLQGRGIDSDLTEDWQYRLSKQGVLQKMHPLSPDELREHVRFVLKTELEHKVEFDSLDVMWEKRWLWCVNGAHSRFVEGLDPTLKMDDPALKGKRLHRRVFAENTSVEPVSSWSGKSYYNLSAKLEPGKTRAIYGCDTVTYFAFEHLLRPVENKWLGRRVILDPGMIGTFGMARRLKRLRKFGSGVHVMLDYDDYNARHTLEVQAMVIEELAAHVGYDEALTEKLTHSIMNSYLLNPNTRQPEKVEGTLMSGHRATTFINSVLNYAYIAACQPSVKDMLSMHVGDDVYIYAPSIEEAILLLNRCKQGGLAMNPMKQSVGNYTAEFLRVAYREDHCCGYLCRSIASCINGNWVGEIKLNYDEGLRTILNHAWTLVNRCNWRHAGLMLRSAIVRMAHITGRVADNLLTGKWALGGDACRYSREHTLEVYVKQKVSPWTKKLDEDLKTMKNRATVDYLSNHADAVEIDTMEKLKLSLVPQMVRASYGKTMAPAYIDAEEVKPKLSVRMARRRVRGMMEADAAWDSPKQSGCFNSMPLMNLMRNAIGPDLLSEQVTNLTGLILQGVELEHFAWGHSSRGCAIRGVMTFADANRVAGAAGSKLLTCRYNCFA